MKARLDLRDDDVVERELDVMRAELVEHVGGNPNVVQRIAITRIGWLQLHLAALDVKICNGGELTPADRAAYSSFGSALADALAALEPSPGASGQGGLRRVERVVVYPADEATARDVIVGRLDRIRRFIGLGTDAAVDEAPPVFEPPCDVEVVPVVTPRAAIAGPHHGQRSALPPQRAVVLPQEQRAQPPSLLDQALIEAARSRPAFMHNTAVDPEFYTWTGSTEN